MTLSCLNCWTTLNLTWISLLSCADFFLVTAPVATLQDCVVLATHYVVEVVISFLEILSAVCSPAAVIVFCHGNDCEIVCVGVYDVWTLSVTSVVVVLQTDSCVDLGKGSSFCRRSDSLTLTY